MMATARMPSRVTDTSVEVIPAEGYRTTLWHEARRGCVSASEIATVLGISRFQSRFDLWWSKRLNDRQAENDAMSRGRRCEPLVLEDFIEEHPHLKLRHVGLVRSVERPWQVATPDAIAYETSGQTLKWTVDGSQRDFTELEPVAVVEAKTDGGSDHWGERGTDQIPVDYKAQVLWQMDATGIDIAYVPVWIGFAYRCYVIHADADDLAFMREQAQEFLASLERGDQPPVDAAKTTTDRLKRLHADVVEEDRVISESLLGQYLAAVRLRDAATARVRLAENRMRAVLGNGNRLVLPDGRKAASRSVYDVPARTQTIGAHTVDRLNVRHPKETRELVERRAVRCSGTTADDQRCRRVHVTSATSWTCRDHTPERKAGKR